MDYTLGFWVIEGPTFTLQQNLANSVGGVSVGINSLVFAIDRRLLVGVGGLGFATGPYANLTSSIAGCVGNRDRLVQESAARCPDRGH
jgi:hypothetical protein